MDIYKILKFNNFIKSHRLKFFGLWLLNVLDKRYLAIQMDPVMACNLRCKMCYFTDEAYVRATMKGVFQEEILRMPSNFKLVAAPNLPFSNTTRGSLKPLKNITSPISAW